MNERVIKAIRDLVVVLNEEGCDVNLQHNSYVDSALKLNEATSSMHRNRIHDITVEFKESKIFRGRDLLM